jgi:hypothetical protein
MTVHGRISQLVECGSDLPADRAVGVLLDRKSLFESGASLVVSLLVYKDAGKGRQVVRRLRGVAAVISLVDFEGLPVQPLMPSAASALSLPNSRAASTNTCRMARAAIRLK